MWRTIIDNATDGHRETQTKKSPFLGFHNVLQQERRKGAGSDHDESAHDVRGTVDETEVHHVLAAETDGWTWQRVLPTTGGRAVGRPRSCVP